VLALLIVKAKMMPSNPRLKHKRTGEAIQETLRHDFLYIYLARELFFLGDLRMTPLIVFGSCHCCLSSQMEFNLLLKNWFQS